MNFIFVGFYLVMYFTFLHLDIACMG